MTGLEGSGWMGDRLGSLAEWGEEECTEIVSSLGQSVCTAPSTAGACSTTGPLSAIERPTGEAGGWTGERAGDAKAGQDSEDSATGHDHSSPEAGGEESGLRGGGAGSHGRRGGERAEADGRGLRVQPRGRNVRGRLLMAGSKRVALGGGRGCGDS